MHVTVIKAQDLTPGQLADWSEIQRANPDLDSPFFSPEFTRAVSAVRNDVEVGLLQKNNRTVGYFPFQRGRWNIGRPVGGRLCDFQAVIAPADLQWDAQQLVRGCRLAAWDFDHLLTTQKSFEKTHRVVEPAAYMDLSDGFDAYCRDRRQAGSGRLRHAAKILRRAQREVGAVRFQAHTADPGLLETLLQWKSLQYHNRNVADVFACRWTVDLLRHLFNNPTDTFGCILSTLYLGEHLAAIELGLRYRHVDHSWFPAYNEGLSRYSPGTLLMVELARECGDLGIKRIELGSINNMPYKTSFMSGCHLVARGSVGGNSALHWVRESWHRSAYRMKTSILRKPIQLVGRWTRPVRGWLALR